MIAYSTNQEVYRLKGLRSMTPAQVNDTPLVGSSVTHKVRCAGVRAFPGVSFAVASGLVQGRGKEARLVWRPDDWDSLRSLI